MPALATFGRARKIAKVIKRAKYKSDGEVRGATWIAAVGIFGMGDEGKGRKSTRSHRSCAACRRATGICLSRVTLSPRGGLAFSEKCTNLPTRIFAPAFAYVRHAAATFSFVGSANNGSRHLASVPILSFFFSHLQFLSSILEPWTRDDISKRTRQHIRSTKEKTEIIVKLTLNTRYFFITIIIANCNYFRYDISMIWSVSVLNYAHKFIHPHIRSTAGNCASGGLNSRCVANALDANYLNLPSAPISRRRTVNS